MNVCLPNLSGPRRGVGLAIVVVVMVLLMGFTLALFEQTPTVPVWAVIALVGVVGTWTVRICRGLLTAAPNGTGGPARLR